MSKEEKENRYQYIAGLFRKGWSKLSITEHLSELWGIKKQASANWIKQTYKYINSNDESFVKNLRRIQLERLELMLQKAMEKEDWKVANTIADTINKTFSLYEIKQKIEITDNVIRFKFGEANENAYKNIDTELTDEQEKIMDESNGMI
jgi:hypothetical protein